MCVGGWVGRFGVYKCAYECVYGLEWVCILVYMGVGRCVYRCKWVCIWV